MPNLVVGALYTVRLHFAENWETGVGARRFNVRINGATVLSDFDVYAAAGNRTYTAVVKEFAAIADQGFIAVDFSPGSASNPMVCGIEVVLGGTLTPPPDPPPTSPPPTPTNLARGATASASSQWDASYAA